MRSRLAVSTAAIVAFAAAAFLAVDHLAGPGAGRATSEPAFLTKELGVPQHSLSLVRKPAPHTTVKIRPAGGYTVAHAGRGRVTGGA